MLSEGGPYGREEERWRLRPFGVLAAPFVRRPAARSRSGLSEFRMPSIIEAMMTAGWTEIGEFLWIEYGLGRPQLQR